MLARHAQAMRPGPSKKGNKSTLATRGGRDMRCTTPVSMSTRGPRTLHSRASSVPTMPLAPPTSAASNPIEHSSMDMNPYTTPWQATDSAAFQESVGVRRYSFTGSTESRGMCSDR